MKQPVQVGPAIIVADGSVVGSPTFVPSQGERVEVLTPVHIDDLRITGLDVEIAELKRLSESIERIAAATEKMASLLAGWMESHP